MQLSAQGMTTMAIARVAFTSEDRVRDVIGNFNAGGFTSLCELGEDKVSIQADGDRSVRMSSSIAG